MHRLAWSLLTVSLVLAFPDDRPEPLLELAFDAGMPEDVDPADYAPGEGALILPGPWRDCLDLTAASRFGGTLQQMEPAGGALLLSDGRLNDLRDFTVTLWAKAVGGDEAINARALNKMGSWELNYSRGRFQFLVVSGERKSAFAVPARGVRSHHNLSGGPRALGQPDPRDRPQAGVSGSRSSRA